MKLSKAGAGLPYLERLFIKRILVPMARILFSWNIALFMIRREVVIINKLIKNINPEELKKQIIIERTFAIEDDSRRFSINMVLEHLIIAGSLVEATIVSLSNEEMLEDNIKIEDVKPFENSEKALDNFFYFYKTYSQVIENLPQKQSIATRKHPWFVRFNNFDWNIFMYMHTFIHRRQIEEIIKNLGLQND